MRALTLGCVGCAPRSPLPHRLRVEAVQRPRRVEPRGVAGPAQPGARRVQQRGGRLRVHAPHRARYGEVVAEADLPRQAALERLEVVHLGEVKALSGARNHLQQPDHLRGARPEERAEGGRLLGVDGQEAADQPPPAEPVARPVQAPPEVLPVHGEQAVAVRAAELQEVGLDAPQLLRELRRAGGPEGPLEGAQQRGDALVHEQRVADSEGLLRDRRVRPERRHQLAQVEPLRRAPRRLRAQLPAGEERVEALVDVQEGVHVVQHVLGHLAEELQAVLGAGDEAADVDVRLRGEVAELPQERLDRRQVGRQRGRPAELAQQRPQQVQHAQAAVHVEVVEDLVQLLHKQHAGREAAPLQQHQHAQPRVGAEQLEEVQVRRRPPPHDVLRVRPGLLRLVGAREVVVGHAEDGGVVEVQNRQEAPVEALGALLGRGEELALERLELHLLHGDGGEPRLGLSERLAQQPARGVPGEAVRQLVEGYLHHVRLAHLHLGQVHPAQELQDLAAHRQVAHLELAPLVGGRLDVAVRAREHLEERDVGGAQHGRVAGHVTGGFGGQFENVVFQERHNPRPTKSEDLAYHCPNSLDDTAEKIELRLLQRRCEHFQHVRYAPAVFPRQHQNRIGPYLLQLLDDLLGPTLAHGGIALEYAGENRRKNQRFPVGFAAWRKRTSLLKKLRCEAAQRILRKLPLVRVRTIAQPFALDLRKPNVAVEARQHRGHPLDGPQSPYISDHGFILQYVLRPLARLEQGQHVHPLVHDLAVPVHAQELQVRPDQPVDVHGRPGHGVLEVRDHPGKREVHVALATQPAQRGLHGAQRGPQKLPHAAQPRIGRGEPQLALRLEVARVAAGDAQGVKDHEVQVVQRCGTDRLGHLVDANVHGPALRRLDRHQREQVQDRLHKVELAPHRLQHQGKPQLAARKLAHLEELHVLRVRRFRRGVTARYRGVLGQSAQQRGAKHREVITFILPQIGIHDSQDVAVHAQERKYRLVDEAVLQQVVAAAAVEENADHHRVSHVPEARPEHGVRQYVQHLEHAGVQGAAQLAVDALHVVVDGRGGALLQRREEGAELCAEAAELIIRQRVGRLDQLEEGGEGLGAAGSFALQTGRVHAVLVLVRLFARAVRLARARHFDAVYEQLQLLRGLQLEVRDEGQVVGRLELLDGHDRPRLETAVNKVLLHERMQRVKQAQPGPQLLITDADLGREGRHGFQELEGQVE
ncbi:uncharacterized protein BcabD6B2_42690 [Babesia caballi]|uniref:Uncharacterized protein n=1 Tax=Babesia caballi TaxID=5871 RepID=A0AAV4LYJ5_BABCB|nr:hypothetical protein, conserved [Babesia caballi]